MNQHGFQNTLVGLACTATLAIPATVVLGNDTTPTPKPNDSDARINALEQQIAAIRSESAANWLSDERAEQIRALVEDSVSDAGQRRSLLAEGGNAGWGSHPFIQNEDGSFSLNFSGQVQTRFVWNNRDDSGGDDSIAGFEIRRAKLGFGGNLFGKDFTYKVKGAFNRKTGAFEMEDAWGKYKLSDTMYVKFGQFKPGFLREELTSSSVQLAVDRSYITELSTQNFSQGVQIGFQQDNFRATASFDEGWGVDWDGDNSGNNNTNFSGAAVEWAATARVEVMLAGDNFKQFKDYQSWSDDEFGFLLGGAVHAQNSERGTAAASDDSTMWTIDASAEFGGAHLEGYLVGQHRDTGTSSSEYDQFGFVVSGGIFLKPDEFELFGRYEWFDFDGAVSAGYEDEISLFTVGATWFWEGHNKKWTTDIVFAGDPLPDGASGLGLEKDAVGQDGQYTIRSQVQFLF